MSTHDTQMIDRFINAIHKEENLDKYLLALQVIKEGIVYDKTQMLLFDSIDFDKIIEKMLSYPKILIMTLYHKDTFEFLLDHWTFDGTEAIEIISAKGKRVGFINEDEVFGELSILLNTKRTVTAIALKQSNALVIPKKSLRDDYKKTSFFIKAILRSTYLRLTNLNSTIKTDLKSLNK